MKEKTRDKIFFLRYAVYFRNKMLGPLTSYFSPRNRTSLVRAELKQIFPRVKKKRKISINHESHALHTHNSTICFTTRLQSHQWNMNWKVNRSNLDLWSYYKIKFWNEENFSIFHQSNFKRLYTQFCESILSNLQSVRTIYIYIYPRGRFSLKSDIRSPPLDISLSRYFAFRAILRQYRGAR